MIEISREDLDKALNIIYKIGGYFAILYGAFHIHIGLLYIALGISVFALSSNFKELLSVTVVMPIISNKVHSSDMSSQLDEVVDEIVKDLNIKTDPNDNPDPS
jgi:hypothetical protein